MDQDDTIRKKFKVQFGKSYQLRSYLVCTDLLKKYEKNIQERCRFIECKLSIELVKNFTYRQWKLLKRSLMLKQKSNLYAASYKNWTSEEHKLIVDAYTKLSESHWPVDKFSEIHWADLLSYFFVQCSKQSIYNRLVALQKKQTKNEYEGLKSNSNVHDVKIGLEYLDTKEFSEDEKLVKELVRKLEYKDWSEVKSYLERQIDKSFKDSQYRPWTLEEVDVLCEAYEKLGSSWNLINNLLPTRTFTAVKSCEDSLLRYVKTQARTFYLPDFDSSEEFQFAAVDELIKNILEIRSEDEMSNDHCKEIHIKRRRKSKQKLRKKKVNYEDFIWKKICPLCDAIDPIPDIDLTELIQIHKIVCQSSNKNSKIDFEDSSIGNDSFQISPTKITEYTNVSNNLGKKLSKDDHLNSDNDEIRCNGKEDIIDNLENELFPVNKTSSEYNKSKIIRNISLFKKKTSTGLIETNSSANNEIKADKIKTILNLSLQENTLHKDKNEIHKREYNQPNVLNNFSIFNSKHLSNCNETSDFNDFDDELQEEISVEGTTEKASPLNRLSFINSTKSENNESKFHHTFSQSKNKNFETSKGPFEYVNNNNGRSKTLKHFTESSFSQQSDECDKNSKNELLEHFENDESFEYSENDSFLKFNDSDESDQSDVDYSSDDFDRNNFKSNLVNTNVSVQSKKHPLIIRLSS